MSSIRAGCRTSSCGTTTQRGSTAPSASSPPHRGRRPLPRPGPPRPPFVVSAAEPHRWGDGQSPRGRQGCPGLRRSRSYLVQTGHDVPDTPGRRPRRGEHRSRPCFQARKSHPALITSASAPSELVDHDPDGTAGDRVAGEAEKDRGWVLAGQPARAARSWSRSYVVVPSCGVASMRDSRPGGTSS
jgi:hypothetical protein